MRLSEMYTWGGICAGLLVVFSYTRYCQTVFQSVYVSYIPGPDSGRAVMQLDPHG